MVARMKPSKAVRDLDYGWKAFRETVKALKREQPEMICGITGPEAETRSQPRRRTGKSQKQPAATAATPTMVELAAMHEFGAGVPERSFLRSTFDLHVGEYKTILKRELKRDIELAITQKRPVLRAADSRGMKRVALKMEGDVKKRIGTRQIPPPNAPSTIAQKGSDTPLIDTGKLRQSITSAVRTATSGAVSRGIK